MTTTDDDLEVAPRRRMPPDPQEFKGLDRIEYRRQVRDYMKTPDEELEYEDN